MEELIEKVEILKDELDKNKSIVNIKKLNKKIMEDKELITLLEKYKNTNNINLKKEIMSNELFKKYSVNAVNITCSGKRIPFIERDPVINSLDAI